MGGDHFTHNGVGKRRYKRHAKPAFVSPRHTGSHKASGTI
jgi:hypothetical protein